MKKILTVLSAAALLSASALAQDKTINVAVRATFPELEGDYTTEVPSHQLKLLVGDENSTNAATGLQIPLTETSPGLFTGQVNIGNYDIEDIRFVGWGTPWKPVPEPLFVVYYKDNIALRASVPVLSPKKTPRQIQKKDGVLDRFYMYAPVSLKQQSDSTYVADVQLRFANAYAKFNVYGKARKMDKEEILQSVTMTRYTKEEAQEEGLNKPGNHINSNPYINGATGKIYNYTNGRASETVLLKQPCTIADRKKSDAVKVYMITYANGAGTRAQAFSYIKTITVETDKAVYTKTYDALKYSRSVGDVTEFDLDLSTFKRKSKD